MGYLKYYSMTLASIFTFLEPVSMMWRGLVPDSSCDYYQNVMMGQTYYVYNPEYPNHYGPDTACRWVASSEIGTKIVLMCNIDMPSDPNTSNCKGDRLPISLSGNEDLSDSSDYCGSGTISLVTHNNSLAVGLFAAGNTRGGKFMCTVTAIQDATSTAETPAASTCDCGWTQESRIVGGVETGVNEYIEMAGIVDFIQKSVYCGCTILSDRYAVTAAHCVLKRDASTIGVLAGDHDIESGLDTPSAALYQISKYEIHPAYNTITNANDIALIQTKTKMVFSLRVGPACLPFRFTSYDFTGQVLTALGWGQLEFSGPASDTLQKVNLTVISNSECAPAYDEPITANQLCTYEQGQDACQSDSGGPLLWTDLSTNRRHLIAVISFGKGCATTVPGVNTRITSYLSWIVSRTSDAAYCIK